MTALAGGFAVVCLELRQTHLVAIAGVCRACDHCNGATKAAMSAVVPGTHKTLLRPLLDAWSSEPSVPGIALATAIESISAATRLANHAEVDVVCTGPDSPLAPVRLTSQVVLQLINSATTRVTISSFSSYKITSVMKVLSAAVARGFQGLCCVV